MWRVHTRPFAGINYPFHDSSVIIAGAPLDATNSFMPGTRFAPEAVRKVSESLELYSYLLDSPIEGKKFHDVGDLFPHGLSLDKSLEVIRDFVEYAGVREGKKLAILGGEHTITLGSAPLMRRGLAVIVFDAHADLRDSYLGDRYSHATVVRRLVESLGRDSLILIGVRALAKEEAEFVKKRGIQVFTSRYINVYGAGATVDRLKDALSTFSGAYLSIDVDVLDPAFAPGVGTPEPLGLDAQAFFSLLKAVFESTRVAGIDVVEINPLMDRGYQTSSIGAKIVLEFLAMQG